MPLQAPLALLGPPALEAWLCSRVRAGTAGARWGQMVTKHGDVTAGEVAFRELGFRVPEGRGGLDLSMRGLVAPWA